MAFSLKTSVDVVRKTLGEFLKDDCPQMAAALAYYTVFSLPPLLFLVIVIAGMAFGQQAVEGRVEQEITSLMGQEAARQIQEMISNASQKIAGGRGFVASVFGAAALIFGATGAFAQLQRALNRAWEVTPDPERGGLKGFLLKRLLSFGMIVGTGFLLLVSLVLSTAITALASEIQDILPAGMPVDFARVVDFLLSLTIITFLFGALFKILPDAEITWEDVGVGAGVTALLFVAGKFLMGFYLAQSDPGSAFGAAGSLVLVLVWIYYSSLLVLFGAEFTQVWARRYGKRIAPSKGAVRIHREIVRDSPSAMS